MNIDDTLQIVTKMKLFKSYGFETLAAFEKWAKSTKRLRDVLAHGGGVLDYNPEPKKTLQQVIELYELAANAFGSTG